MKFSKLGRGALALAGAGILLASCFGCAGKVAEADLVLVNGDVFTFDPQLPEGRGLAVTGNTITAVFKSDGQARKYIGPETVVIDLTGKWAVPGIIDGHVHFNAAGGLILDANLMTVSDEEGLRREIGRVASILEEGEWITGGLYGAYEQWALGDAGAGSEGKTEPWRPKRAMIDDLTPKNPCFLCRFDYAEWLANTAALKEAGLEGTRTRGLEIGQDGQASGIIFRGNARLRTDEEVPEAEVTRPAPR